ncbi:MAG: biotin--[acetyl-CoA-carboxylase] ligase [Phycisphaeraceae bacterium]
MHPASSHPIVDVRLLDALLHAREPATVEALALQSGQPAKVILRELGRLRAAGCELAEHPQHGVRLRTAGLSVWRDYLEWRGKPRQVEVYRQTGSTQEAGRRLLAAHGRAADGALVIADAQTAGRGRLGRRWFAPAGKALTFSRVCCAAGEAAGTVDRLTFATSVALAEALDRWLAGVARVDVKWPNDICVGGRKLAGILVETVREQGGGTAAVIGIGLNVHVQASDLPADEPGLRERVTSLAMLGAAGDRLAVLADVADAVDTALRDTAVDDLLARWRQRCTMLHQHVTLQSDGRRVAGQVLDLDPHAGLIVRLDTGELVHLPAATTSVVV